MTPVILIICLIAQRYYTDSILSDRIAIFNHYVNALEGHTKRLSTWNCWGALIVFLSPAIIAITAIQLVLGSWHLWFGVWSFLFSIVILLFCLRTPPQDEQLQACHAAIKAQDFSKASNIAQAIFGRCFSTTPSSFISLLSQALLDDAVHYLFSIIFWYILLGPTGAITIRLLWSLQQHLVKQDTVSAKFLLSACQTLLYYLHWPVIRLMGLSFALVGNFSTAFSFWLQHAMSLQSHQNFLGESACAALAIDPDQHQPSIKDHHLIIGMLNHSLVIWLVILVLVHMGEWLL
jgi:membrane protein required for beta-lactamase induction